VDLAREGVDRHAEGEVLRDALKARQQEARARERKEELDAQRQPTEAGVSQTRFRAECDAEDALRAGGRRKAEELRAAFLLTTWTSTRRATLSGSSCSRLLPRRGHPEQTRGYRMSETHAVSAPGFHFSGSPRTSTICGNIRPAGVRRTQTMLRASSGPTLTWTGRSVA
jgi:hypothetical protein